MLKQATKNLIAINRDASSTDADVKAATQAFCNAVGNSSADEANEALAALTVLFDLDDMQRAAFVALLCGTYVEKGADPLAIAQPLIARLRSLLDLAGELAAACLSQKSATKTGDQELTEEEVRKRLASTMPHQNAAWEALQQFWPPAIAVFSASAKARASAKGLRNSAAALAVHHEAGHWIKLILSVLDSEPILVLEPQTRLGILAHISGVVDNFQLNVLLMDGFPSLDSNAPRRVSQPAADIARGNGPQSTGETIHGVWNLYTWKAIQANGQLPDPKDSKSKSFWIWNEGVPGDIPVFEERRVIMLGPASYVRCWGSQRLFAGLPAKFECERQLSKDEVDNWLQRMIAAKSAN